MMSSNDSGGVIVIQDREYLSAINTFCIYF
jgi:hypothetical protein